MNSRILVSAILLALSPLALPQQARASTSEMYKGGHVTHIQATTGPVTVRWGQPEVLAKANEYHVQVSDFDANADGLLSRAEIPGMHALQYEFHVVDSNNNGYLSAAELVNWQ